MGGGRGGKRNKKKKKRGGGGGSSETPSASASASAYPPSPDLYEFVTDAGPGCHIARLCDPRPASSSSRGDDFGRRRRAPRLDCDVLPPPPWILSVEKFDPSEYDEEDLLDVPDLCVDPEGMTLSATNAGDEVRVYYVSVYDVTCGGGDGRVLESGFSFEEEEEKEEGAGGADGGAAEGREEKRRGRKCTTFIVLCPPRTFAHLCRIHCPPGTDLSDVRIDSDVSDYDPHPDPTDSHPVALAFPLLCPSAGSTSNVNTEGEKEMWGRGFLCTQGIGGHLTHFFRGNHHAYDFRCPVGTPVLAGGDGVVVSVRDGCRRTGVGVSNLYAWNSVMIKLDDEGGGGGGDGNGNGNSPSATAPVGRTGPLYAEYVHVDPHTVLVRPGEQVRRRQVLCMSGGAGFSPEPHLHVSAFRSEDDRAPTVAVEFESEGGGRERFAPKAGRWYNDMGEVVLEVAVATREVN